MAAHSSMLVWKIPWTEETGGQQSVGSQELDRTQRLNQHQTCQGLPWWLSGKESACQCRRLGFNPWVGKILQRRKWQPTPVCLPGKSHGKGSLEKDTVHGISRVGHNLASKQQVMLQGCRQRLYMVTLNKVLRTFTYILWAWGIYQIFIIFQQESGGMRWLNKCWDQCILTVR